MPCGEKAAWCYPTPSHSPCRPAHMSHCQPLPPVQICRQDPAEGRRGWIRPAAGRSKFGGCWGDKGHLLPKALAIMDLTLPVVEAGLAPSLGKGQDCC